MVSVVLALTALAVARVVLAITDDPQTHSRIALKPAPATRTPGTKGAPVVVRVDRQTSLGVSRLRLGVTHMQFSLDPFGNKAAVARGKRLLRGLVTYQNQHIYGFGVRNPEPSPGTFVWKGLDRRMSTIQSMGATPVITLCCAPDWMTSLGTTSSRYPNIPPTRAHIPDFARLAARVARRYPDVRHFIVWNEMKGFYDDRLRNWNYKHYTDLYNAVYDALKEVNPAIKVGGPYLNIQGTGSRSLGKTGAQTADPITRKDRKVLDYWLAHKRGAQFVAVDRNVTPSHDPNRYSPIEELQLARWFGEVVKQVRQRTNLPVWYAEHHMDDGRSWGFQRAGTAAMLLSELRGGTDVALQWQPQGLSTGVDKGNQQSLFSDTRLKGGGRPFPNLRVYRLIKKVFPPGTPMYPATPSSPVVEALASPAFTVLVNLRRAKTRVIIGNRQISLRAYGVKAIPDFPHP